MQLESLAVPHSSQKTFAVSRISKRSHPQSSLFQGLSATGKGRAFPESSNPWDSLGEAYAANGEIDRAIAADKKSLELNPENTNGVAELERLRVDKESGSRIRRRPGADPQRHQSPTMSGEPYHGVPKTGAWCTPSNTSSSAPSSRADSTGTRPSPQSSRLPVRWS